MEDMNFKKLLTPTRMPPEAFFRGDYTLNLYRGCNHGCIYCDSRSVCYQIEHFDKVRAKKDCLPALEAELRSKKRAGVVCMGAASDAYNAFERKRLITRGALELLLRYGFGVFIPTKGALIARDADVLSAIAGKSYCCASFSITTADDALAGMIEPGAPSATERFSAMQTLSRTGVLTGTWLNPMLPYVTDNEHTITQVLQHTADAGGRFAICHFGVTLREGDREYYYQALEGQPQLAGIKAQYVAAYGLQYICTSPRAEALAAHFDAECKRLHLLNTFAAVNQAAAAYEPRQISLFG